MELTKMEQETIVLFNEAESTAEIYTHNTKLKNKLRRLTNKCLFLSVNDSGNSVSVTVPKNLLTIGIRSPMSEQERLSRSERAKKNKPLAKHCKYAEVLPSSILR